MQLDNAFAICSYSSVTMPFIQDSHLPLSSFVKTHIDIPDRLDSPLSIHAIMNNGPDNNGGGYRQASAGTLSTSQALDLARTTEEGAHDPVVISILEGEINRIWIKIQTEPATYVMSREEFGVFNYFQNRFRGQELAAEAQRKYWDSNHS
ncbi:hypothetical protein MFRU_016g00100 [Monilinia fructicola]|uniref:Uncharacterized protein n=1 Tax=Monilinia fructicola TaxID=38448 RepID=A0A5M9JS47_MONFR|nr:hypothetical protein EYC84_001517 [Monilinia fructicola]KAG4029252.1 hypothetical protein MFRU_016g00100 [Monilinia fructicola]